MTAPLRAATWSRVSSKRQSGSDREGLPYQQDLLREAERALGASDTGIHYVLTQSGKNVHSTPEWAAMIAGAGTDWDLLLVPYSSRLARNTEETLRAIRLIGEAGGRVYFCEEKTDTGDERSFENFTREAVESEAYIRRLSRTMKRTNQSRWERRGLPVGKPPFGYGPGFVIDNMAAAKVRRIFELYAQGNTALNDIATRTDINLADEQVKVIVRNPAYKAVAQLNGQERPASFEPIVTEELWNKVEAMRIARRFAGSPRSSRPQMLQNRLWCACGAKTRLDGADGTGRARVRHLNPCHIWGQAERRQARFYEDPLRAALSSIQLTDETIERWVNDQPTTPPPDRLPYFETKRTKVRADFLNGKITASEADAMLAEIGQDIDMYLYDLRNQPNQALDADTLRANLRNFSGVLARAKGLPSEDAIWTTLIATYIERIEHRGADKIGLIPSRTGLDTLIPATLPRTVQVGGVGGGGEKQRSATRLVTFDWLTLPAAWLSAFERPRLTTVLA